MRDWRGASVRRAAGAAGCATIADVALQRERSAYSSAISRRRSPTPPVDRVLLMRCPSSTLKESTLLAVLRFALGVLVAVGAITTVIASVVASVGLDLM